MVVDYEHCLDSINDSTHYISKCMIEILEIFWASPIELRVIIVGTPIVFILLAYLGIAGTNEAIDFQNKMWRDEEWRKKNK